MPWLCLLATSFLGLTCMASDCLLDDERINRAFKPFALPFRCGIQVMAALVKRAAFAWYKGCEAALPVLRLPQLLQLGAEACLMERMLGQLVRQPADKLFKAVRHHVANHVRSVSCLESSGCDAVC